MTLDVWQENGGSTDGEFFAKRLKKYKSVGYGISNKNRRLLHKDRKKVKLSVSNEEDLRQHQINILFLCGANLGFLGSNEHAYLELMHVRKGEYKEGNRMEVYTYYGFRGFEDKIYKLHLTNVYHPNDNNLMRCPCIKGDPENLARSIEKYFNKCTHEQPRFYCKANYRKKI